MFCPPLSPFPLCCSPCRYSAGGFDLVFVPLRCGFVSSAVRACLSALPLLVLACRRAPSGATPFPWLCAGTSFYSPSAPTSACPPSVSPWQPISSSFGLRFSALRVPARLRMPYSLLPAATFAAFSYSFSSVQLFPTLLVNFLLNFPPSLHGSSLLSRFFRILALPALDLRLAFVAPPHAPRSSAPSFPVPFWLSSILYILLWRVWPVPQLCRTPSYGSLEVPPSTANLTSVPSYFRLSNLCC